MSAWSCRETGAAGLAHHLLTAGKTTGQGTGAPGTGAVGLAGLSGYIEESWRPAIPVDGSTGRGPAWLVRDDGLVFHHGFTGTSLYLHPRTGRYLVVLTNAIAQGRERTGLGELRALAAAQFN